MDIIEILLMPFVFIYKGVKVILLSPYYVVAGLINLISPKKQVKEEKKVISEIKEGEKVKVVKGVRSAYSTPTPPPKETDPVKIKQNHDQNTLKRQKEFEKLVAKARLEEQKRAKEQEKVRLEIEKKEKLRKAKEDEKKKKEDAIEEIRAKKEEELRKAGKSNDIFVQLKQLFIKMKYNKKEMQQLEAKKRVLDEQINSQKGDVSRYAKPLLFDYIARNPKGELEKSSIEALSRVDVHSFLLQEGYEVYDITAAKTSMNINLGSFKFSKSQLIFYLTQLSAYLKSGIALADAVKILDNQAKKVNEKKAWRAVYYDLSMGDNLSLAMEKRKNVFPQLLINMIKTAEMTGNLTETLDDMVEYYTESEANRKKMKSAMTYPAVVSTFAIAVVIVIFVYIIPQFEDIYGQMGGELPTITKVTINVSKFLQNYIIYMLLGLVVFVLLFIYLYKNVKSFKKRVQEFSMKLPVFGNIIIYNQVNIFTKTFANLINHNVFITDSIDVLSKITSNEIYKRLIFETASNLTKGESISKAFDGHWAFPDVAYQMLLTGEKTGRLGPMMEKVSEYYQEQQRNMINSMKSIIEPILIIFLALVVGVILLVVIIPMFDMYNQLK